MQPWSNRVVEEANLFVPLRIELQEPLEPLDAVGNALRIVESFDPTNSAYRHWNR